VGVRVVGRGREARARERRSAGREAGVAAAREDEASAVGAGASGARGRGSPAVEAGVSAAREDEASAVGAGASGARERGAPAAEADAFTYQVQGPD
jgi:hypothetical protein